MAAGSRDSTGGSGAGSGAGALHAMRPPGTQRRGRAARPAGSRRQRRARIRGAIPTVSGRERLTVSVTCGGDCSTAVRADASFEFDVAEPSPGTVTVEGDAGAVIVRVREGAPSPRVHVKGTAGMVKVVEE